MSAGHSDCYSPHCLEHSWFKVHSSCHRQLSPHVLVLAFKWLDFSMKIKIVSDAWGRRKVRKKETVTLLLSSSFSSAGQAESRWWEGGWSLRTWPCTEWAGLIVLVGHGCLDITSLKWHLGHLLIHLTEVTLKSQPHTGKPAVHLISFGLLLKVPEAEQ